MKQYRDAGYVSMIIDAAGGAGTVFHPHVHKQVHGEPERAELLKTKSTFVKVHGYGNLIVNNYYTGTQGLFFVMRNFCLNVLSQEQTLFLIVCCVL